MTHPACYCPCSQWSDPTQLHGCGKYAADAYYIFCRGAWEAVEPQDKDLRRYHAWLHATGGWGTGGQDKDLRRYHAWLHATGGWGRG